MTFLNNTPEPEVEFAKEIEAAEAELANPPEPASEPAPEVETPASEPEAAAPPIAAKPEPEAQEDSKVPLKALQEARREKQEAERRLAELTGYLQAMQAQQRPPEQPQQPDPIAQSDDPLAQLSAVAQKVQQIEQRGQQSEQINQLSNAYRSAASEYAKEKPDFMDAYNHLVSSRQNELKAMGYSEADIPRIIFNDEMGLAMNAFQQRRNPGEIIYDYAKARGYSGPAPKVEEKPAPKAEEIVSLQKIKAEAATSISTGGKPGTADISDSDLTHLKGAAFDAAWTKKFGGERKMSSLFRE